jgi:hypothetical protein
VYRRQWVLVSDRLPVTFNNRNNQLIVAALTARGDKHSNMAIQRIFETSEVSCKLFDDQLVSKDVVEGTVVELFIWRGFQFVKVHLLHFRNPIPGCDSRTFAVPVAKYVSEKFGLPYRIFDLDAVQVEAFKYAQTYCTNSIEVRALIVDAMPKFGPKTRTDFAVIAAPRAQRLESS